MISPGKIFLRDAWGEVRKGPSLARDWHLPPFKAVPVMEKKKKTSVSRVGFPPSRAPPPLFGSVFLSPLNRTVGTALSNIS